MGSHVNIQNLTETELRGLLSNGLGAIRPVEISRYPKAWETYLVPELEKAKRRNLRMDCKTWFVRDNFLGVIQQPARASDFPEKCGVEEAKFTLAREVWCNAVRQENLDRMGRS